MDRINKRIFRKFLMIKRYNDKKDKGLEKRDSSFSSIVFIVISFLSLMLFSSFIQGEESYSLVEDKAKLPILTPAVAQRQTLKLSLPNGLQAYLISDPQATQSGAVLTVQVGSWEDPDAYPGLAHFLEHMLFLGTKKYPIESDYDRFIRAHGGLSNAYTTSDYTLYLFSINHTAFEEALDRFSYFFKEPLFNPSGVDRELQAIDQEFAKNFDQDESRQAYVYKELSNPEHPYHRFSAGNSSTLSLVSQAVLKDWYHTHYSANLMRLIVYSSAPLETLKSLVIQDFSGIPTTGHPPLEVTNPVMLSERKGHMIYIESILDQRTLELTWELPYTLDPKRFFKPEMLLCYILGDEGPGSLLAALKAENLAEKLDCNGYRLGQHNLLFSLSIDLTEKGLENINAVIKRCFQAINKLKKQPIPPYLFEESKKIATLRYQYQSPEDPFEYLMKMGGLLVHEDLSTFPEQTLIPQAFDPRLIQSFLSYLTPEQASITLMAQANSLPLPLVKKERRMSIPYRTEPFTSSQLTAWSQADEESLDWHLPYPNPFIPDQLSLTPLLESSTEHAIPHPSLLIDTPQGKVYFAKDNDFRLPQITWFFEIQSPLLNKGQPTSSVLADLYIKSLKESLNLFSYPALLADLEYTITQERQGLVLTLTGYSNKAEILFDKILERLNTYRPSPFLFELFKTSQLIEYQNFDQKSALEQSVETFQSLLYREYASSQQKVKALQDVTYEQFMHYVDSLYDQTYVRSLLYGHMEGSQAHRLWHKLQTTLASRPYPSEQRRREEVLVLPDSGPYVLDKTMATPAHAVLLAIEEPAFSFEGRAAQQILSKAMESDFYATLRTKQQTGYLVYSLAEEFDKHLFSFFAVQSHSHDPRDLLARFELFIESFLQEMSQTELTQKHFETIQQALLMQYIQPPQNLLEMGELLKTLAFKYDGDFDWIAKRIQGFQELKYENFIEIARKFLGKQNKKRLAILIRGQVPTLTSLHYEPIENANELKKLSNYTHISE